MSLIKIGGEEFNDKLISKIIIDHKKQFVIITLTGTNHAAEKFTKLVSLINKSDDKITDFEFGDLTFDDYVVSECTTSSNILDESFFFIKMTKSTS